MPKFPENAIARLSSRSRSLVEFVARWRIGTNDVFHKLHFAGRQRSAVTRVTARLCRDEWLASYPLIYPRKYFLPGKRAVGVLGLPIPRSYPLGPQSLPTEYAVLQYTTRGSLMLKRLLPTEVLTSLPWYQQQWLAAPHCLRPRNGHDTIELLRVDLGAPADHVARKCLADIERRARLTEFKQAVRSAAFRLVVITSTTDKSAALHTALDSHSWPAGLAIHISVIPSLFPLLPRSQ